MRYFFCFMAACAIYISASAQSSSQSALRTTFANRLNKLQPGNRKEVLNDLYIGLSSALSQEDGAINFKATPFGLGAAFNKSWKTDSIYLAKKVYRAIQINGSLTPTDSSLFKMQSGSIGITLKLVNGNDKTIADYYNKVNSLINSALSDAIHEAAASIQDVAGQMVEVNKLTSSINEYGKSFDIKDLDPRIIKYLHTDAKAFLALDQQAYAQLVRNIVNRPLVTLSPQLKYDFTTHYSDNFSIRADWQFGIRKDPARTPWHVQFSGNFITAHDTTVKSGSNLLHTNFSVSAGLNMVLKENSDKESTLELKPYFEYVKVLNNKYAAEDLETYKANITFRIRLSEETWLPVTLKYDIKNPKLFGFLTLFWNLN